MFAKLVQQMNWANIKAIEWLNEERKSPEIHLALLSHILNAEKIWISRARNAEHEKQAFTVHDLQDMIILNRENNLGLVELLNLGLNRTFDYKLFNGKMGKSSIEDLVLHVFSHGFHHFGQMAAEASRAGEKFPDLSFIGFTRSHAN